MNIRFLIAVVATAIALTGTPAQAGIRKSITDLSPAELQSLRNGYAQMITWNSAPRNSPEFHRSLLFWANMHAYFGQSCAGGFDPTTPGMSGITTQTPTTPEEFATWCTCEHQSIHFLTWHRMYVYFFEQVLRSAANDNNLTLPYWDYESNGHIPEAFRAPTYVNGSGQTVSNPLYVSNRQAQLNAGTGILFAGVTSTSSANQLTTYPDYNSSLEQTPHGSVHCATGVAGCQTGYMGAVPAAGKDPIFYTHHANIDRLYDCWLAVSPNARAPAVALRNQSFSFIDGQGTQVSRTVDSMMTSQQLGVSYTNGGGCPLRIRIPRVPLPIPVPWWRFVPHGPLTSDTPVTLPSAQVARALRAKTALLVISNPQVETSPTGLVEVMLQGENGKSVSLGVLNAFNQSAPEHHRDTKATPHEIRFDVRDALRQVGAGARVLVRPVAGVVATGKIGMAMELDIRNKPAALRISEIRIEAR